MALTNNPLDSGHGFSVGYTPVISADRDLKNINSLSIQNTNYTDAIKNDYIVRGVNTGFMTLDGSNLIDLPNNTINFINSKIIGINTSGSAYYSVKFETIVTVDGTGDVISRSNIKSIISDNVPADQTWAVEEYDGGANNKYSYATTRSGAADNAKWIGYIQVITCTL